MKRLVLTTCQLGLIFGICTALVVSTASARTWTSKDGRTIEAEYVGAADGKVQLRSGEGGKVYTVPIETLSDADQLLIGDDIFTRKIRENDGSADAYVARGMAHLNRERHEAAMKDLQRAIELDPKNAEAYDGRGQAYTVAGDPVKANSDFDRAIKLDPQLASAYRHRAKNYKALADSKEGGSVFEAKAESYRKSYQAARRAQLKDKGWQPLNSTTGNVTRRALVTQLAKADYDLAERIEKGYVVKGNCGCGGECGCGGKGYGVGGGPGVKGPGYPVKGKPGEPIPPLAIYPEKVKQGETITIVANPSILEKGMPVSAGEKPKSAYGKGSKKEGMGIERVDFYRDVDADGELNTEEDEYLASDGDGADGYWVEVSTAGFPPGKQDFFALPKGAPEVKLTPAEMEKLAMSLEEAAAAEKAIAQQAAQAAEASGVDADQASSLSSEQTSVAEATNEAYDKLKQAVPEAAELVKEASTPMKAVGNLMKAAGTKPGEESKEKCTSCADKAESAAEKLAAAAKKLRSMAEGGEEAYTPGAPVTGQGEITPGEGEQVAAAGPGKGGPGKGGSGEGGSGSGGDEGDDINIHVDDAVDRALGYVEDHDYDRAIDEYGVLIEDEPDSVVYRSARAGAYLARGGYDYAIRDYDRLLVQPELTLAQKVRFYYNRGCAHLAAGSDAAALADFTACIQLEELGDLEYMAYNNRGISYAKQGLLEEAVADFNRAIAVNDSDPLAFKNRGLAYKKLGKVAEAEQDMAKATGLSSL